MEIMVTIFCLCIKNIGSHNLPSLSSMTNFLLLLPPMMLYAIFALRPMSLLVARTLMTSVPTVEFSGTAAEYWDRTNSGGLSFSSCISMVNVAVDVRLGIP